MLAILQARCSSKRLPGKVLRPILGKAMLARQIERLMRARHISRLIVATSTEPDDQPLADLCKELGIACFRGSLTDVLDRFYQAAVAEQPEHLIRLTGDCPLADPEVIDATIACHLDNAYDYTSNALRPTFPDGLDVEVMRFSSLEEAWENALLEAEREHVTPYIYNHPERFRIGHHTQAIDQSALRWTVDRAEDFAMVSQVYEALYPTCPEFSTQDILNFLAQHPEVARINADIVRNEGYFISQAADLSPLNKVTP